MAWRRFEPHDPQAVIRAYEGGESTTAIAERYGVASTTVRSFLMARGVQIRKSGEFRIWSPNNPETIVEAYLTGVSEKEIAARHGRDRTAVRNFLLRHGVAPRGRRESMLVRMAQTPPAERQRLAAAAHAAVRGKPISREHGHRIAKARERTREKEGRGESFLADMLRVRGMDTTPQMAVEIFNIDLAVPPVAVELLVGTANPLGRVADRKKIARLTALSWDVIYVWVTQGHFLGEAAVDAVVEFVAEAAAIGRGTGRTRVVRGGGEVVYDGHGLPQPNS